MLMTFLYPKNIHRKRKGGVLKIETEDRDKGGSEEEKPLQEELERPTKAEEDDEVKEKKKSDDLWASFLSDVGSRPKESTPASQSSITQKVNMSCIERETVTQLFNLKEVEVQPVKSKWVCYCLSGCTKSQHILILLF